MPPLGTSRLKRQPYLCAAEDAPRIPPPRMQLLLLLPLYALHICWLSQVAAPMGIGAENVVGAVVLLGSSARIQRYFADADPPWATVRMTKPALISTLGALGSAYLLSGYAGPICDLLLRALAGLGAPLTDGVRRALQARSSNSAVVHPAALSQRVLEVRPQGADADPRRVRFPRT